MADTWKIARNLWDTFDNNPANQRTVDAMKGMFGLLPAGAGDVASGLLAADDVRRGDYMNAALNGVGVLPFIPSMAGMVKGKGDDIAKAIRQPTKYEQAHEIARQNAVKMLGLPENNTAMDRAKALGFENGWYHGTTHDFNKFGGKTHSKEGHLGAGHYFTSSPVDASANYAGVGPDLTIRLEREAENILNMTDTPWRGSDDPAYQAALVKAAQKLKGDSEGLVIPAMVRSKKPIDISPDARQYIDFTPKYDRDGEFVDDSKNVYKLFKTLEKQGIDPNQVAGSLELYDEIRAADFDNALRQSEPIMYAEDYNTGDLIGNDVIRNIYKGLGYDAVKMDAASAFPNMKNIPQGTKHLIVNNPNQVRSRFAAFDPARINEPDLLGIVNPELLPWLTGAGLLGAGGMYYSGE